MEHNLGIVVSIHPERVAEILDRTRNHIFRKILLRNGITWIYVTKPTYAISYRAIISHGKRPGEIQDPEGLRNDEFDHGGMAGEANFAYQILKLERLVEPFPLLALKTNELLKQAPTKFTYVLPALHEVLQTRLLELIFDDTAAGAQGAIAF